MNIRDKWKTSWKKRMALIFLALVLTVIGALPAQAGTGGPERVLYDYSDLSGWPEAPEITAASAYVIEINSGAVLLDKDGEATSFPASTTKILTALLTLENCALDEEITLSHDAIYDIEEGGHHYDFEEGEVLTVDECLRFLMVESVNEIGYALAEHMGGSLSGFAEMMNARAKELGATNTNFVNPHGLNDENHVTTAKDMARILWGCVQNEQFCYYASLPSVSGIKGRAVRTEEEFPVFANHHRMLIQSSEYYDPDVVCGKTGYTSLAGNTVVTYASRGDMDVIAVIMQGGSDRFTDTRLLLDYAFDSFTARKTTDLLTELGAEGAEPFTLEESTRAESEIVLPNSFDFSRVTTEFALGEVDDEQRIHGTRTWKLGDVMLAQETVSKEYVPETQAPTETEPPETEETVSAVREPSGFLHETLFGWQVLDLLILGGLALLLLVLFGVLIYLIHVWLQDRREASGRKKPKKKRRRSDDWDDED